MAKLSEDVYMNCCSLQVLNGRNPTALPNCTLGCLAGAGNFEGNLDNFGPSLDFNARANSGVQLQHGEATGHSSLWATCPQLLPTGNVLPGAITSGVAHFLGTA